MCLDIFNLFNYFAWDIAYRHLKIRKCTVRNNAFGFKKSTIYILCEYVALNRRKPIGFKYTAQTICSQYYFDIDL